MVRGLGQKMIGFDQESKDEEDVRQEAEAEPPSAQLGPL